MGERGGFTLVELVVVLVILGILATLAVPRFFGRRDLDERFFSDDVLSALRYAQKLAVGSGCDVQVTIAPGGYALLQRAACQTGAFTAAVPHPGSGEASYVGTPPTGVALSATSSPLVFTPLGRSADATVSVGARTLQVVGETGFVHDPAL